MTCLARLFSFLDCPPASDAGALVNCWKLGKVRTTRGAAVVVAGRRERGECMRSASVPPSKNLSCHSDTWCRSRPTRSAMSLFCRPSVARRTISARCCPDACMGMPDAACGLASEGVRTS